LFEYIVHRVLLIGALVMVKIVFSAGETSLLSVPRSTQAHYARQPGLLGWAFRSWAEFPNRILTSIVIGNNILDVVATMLSAYLAVDLANLYGWSRTTTGLVATVAVAVATIFFGEVVPKVMGRTHAARTAVWFILPLLAVDRLLAPLSWAIGGFTRFFVPKASETSAAVVTEEDIKLDIEQGVRQGTIDEDERKMIDSIFRFSDKKVGDVLIPRTEMMAVDIQTPLEGIVDLAVQTGYSRLPVYKISRDNVVGVLHTRDLLSVWKHRELIVLHDILRPPYFVPESMPVDKLLREFQKGRFHMAVVVDEYGGTAGVVTLEDLVEEIIGDIRDEHETEEEKPITRNEDGSYNVEAGTPIEKVNDVIGLRLEPKGEVASLGGYVVELMGKVPKKGRILTDDQAEYTVLEADARKIDFVRVAKLEVATPPKETTKKTRKKKTPEKPVPFEPVSKDLPSPDA
jgi:putative hemolysin